MGMADKLREIADQIDQQEEVGDYIQQLEQENHYLQGENWYLRERLKALGVNPDKRLSVADVMAIEKALEMAQV